MTPHGHVALELPRLHQLRVTVTLFPELRSRVGGSMGRSVGRPVGRNRVEFCFVVLFSSFGSLVRMFVCSYLICCLFGLSFVVGFSVLPVQNCALFFPSLPVS